MAEHSQTVCYCFGHTVGSIRDEVHRAGRSTVVADITAKIKAGACDCERLNPSGRCCLGEVIAVVKDAVAAAGLPPTAAPAASAPPMMPRCRPCDAEAEGTV